MILALPPIDASTDTDEMRMNTRGEDREQRYERTTHYDRIEYEHNENRQYRRRSRTTLPMLDAYYAADLLFMPALRCCLFSFRRVATLCFTPGHCRCYNAANTRLITMTSENNARHMLLMFFSRGLLHSVCRRAITFTPTFDAEFRRSRFAILRRITPLDAFLRAAALR